jgi:hypothetical protein
MKKLNNKMKVYCLAALSCIIFLSACNKDLEQFNGTPASPVLPYSPSAGNIAATLALPGDDSLYYKLVQRSGLLSTLADSTKTFTLFSTNNAGMRLFAYASGVGQKYLTSSWGTTFPNYPLPSQFQLDPLNTPFLRLTISPSINGAIKYVNNIPFFGGAQIDQVVSNGIIHRAYTIIAPPSKVVRDLIATEATLKFFRSAILRADVGQIVKPNLDSTNFLNYLLGYGVTNLTVLTPNDAAMQPVLKGFLTQAYVGFGYSLFSADSLANLKSSVDSLNSPTAGFNILPPANVRGLLAYHILATDTGIKCKPNIRVFSVNVPTTPAFVKTLVNAAPYPTSLHPGVLASAGFTGPFATSVTFTGFKIVGTSAVPSGPAANVVSADKHGVNGIYHIIDRVLFPQ